MSMCKGYDFYSDLCLGFFPVPIKRPASLYLRQELERSFANAYCIFHRMVCTIFHMHLLNLAVNMMCFGIAMFGV